MKVKGFDSFFPQSVHSTSKRKPLLKIENAQWQTLPEDTIFNGIAYAKDSQYKVFETKNFGWVCFHPSSKTPDGNIPGRFIHKY